MVAKVRSFPFQMVPFFGGGVDYINIGNHENLSRYVFWIMEIKKTEQVPFAHPCYLLCIYIYGIRLPRYIGITISHYKDPY